MAAVSALTRQSLTAISGLIQANLVRQASGQLTELIRTLAPHGKSAPWCPNPTSGDLCARDEGRQRCHQLTAVAHAQRQGFGPGKKLRELLGQLAIEQHQAGPARARAQCVVVADAATGDEALEQDEPGTTAVQVAHVHVMRLEAGLRHRVAHFEV